MGDELMRPWAENAVCQKCGTPRAEFVREPDGLRCPNGDNTGAYNGGHGWIGANVLADERARAK